jgi:enamine deaminase RidA (YjgF/YER057c/UK114 family)
MQVERLSGLLGTEPQKMEEAEEQIRSQVINSTVNVDKRLQKLYELIENDLLGRISHQMVYIAPYKVYLCPPSTKIMF